MLTRKMLWFWIAMIGLTVILLSIVVIYVSTSPR
jgi:hypothetical protein